MYNRILVATDGSRLSARAVTSATGLAGLCKAELVVLKVTPAYPVSYFEGAVAYSPKEVAQIEKEWAERAQAVVDAAVQAARKKGVTARGVTVRSDLVAETIMSTARKHKCDLIVMASHGRKGIKRILLGSETQHVLTHSATPVLVLR